MDYKSSESTTDGSNTARETVNHTCCFFGHRDTDPSIREPLKQAIEALIISRKADHFYVGDHGNFDRMVYDVLKELKAAYPHMVYNVVLAYLPKRIIRDDNLIYPAKLTMIAKQFAIPYRNDWMIMHSSYVICHIVRSTGGAAFFVNEAKKNGLTVMNIAK